MTEISLDLIMDDPIRFQIYFELYFDPDLTATHLLERLPINRSTLSYHLSKMVEAGFLEVSVPSTGRQVKTYSLKYREYMKHRVVEEKINDKPNEVKLNYLRRSMISFAFDLRLASILLNELSHKISGDSNISDMIYDDGKMEYNRNDLEELILNNEVFYLSKNQVLKLQDEIYSLILKLKKEELSETEILIEQGDSPAYVGVVGFYPVVSKTLFTEDRITKVIKREESST